MSLKFSRKIIENNCDQELHENTATIVLYELLRRCGPFCSG